MSITFPAHTSYICIVAVYIRRLCHISPWPASTNTRCPILYISWEYSWWIYLLTNPSRLIPTQHSHLGAAIISLAAISWSVGAWCLERLFCSWLWLYFIYMLSHRLLMLPSLGDDVLLSGKIMSCHNSGFFTLIILLHFSQFVYILWQKTSTFFQFPSVWTIRLVLWEHW